MESHTRKVHELHQSEVQDFRAALKESVDTMGDRVVAAACKRRLERGLLKCMMSWQAWSMRQVCNRRRMARMCHRLLYSLLTRSFLSWRSALASSSRPITF